MPARLEVVDVFRRFPEAYRERSLTPDQGRAVRAILACRTATLGGHLELCPSCGYSRPAYNSCRNRHCPKCQGLAQARWVRQCMERILPVHYFHVVFTLPQQLRALVHRNRRCLFELLFASAARTLLEIGADPRHLGAQIGFTAVLHTWTRDLGFHPHLHTIVSGGGLAGDGTWLGVRSRRFLFPVKVLSQLFRGKFLAGLERAYNDGRLHTDGPLAHLADPEAFQQLLAPLYRKEWVVYSKRPFAGPAQVSSYFGHYTHRVGISNHRLLEMDETSVRFKTRNGKTTTLDGGEFVRRFLLHVLPKGFVKIRHYGMMAAANATRLAKAKAALDVPDIERPVAFEAPETVDQREPLVDPTAVDLTRCPQCGEGILLRQALHPRSPPGVQRPAAS